MKSSAPPLLLRFSFNATIATASTALILLSACASTGAPADASMARYEQLSVQSDGVRGYRSPLISRYRHAEVAADDIDVASEALSDEQARELKLTLAAALTANLHKTGLRHPGLTPSLRVRARVTSVSTANPIVNALTTVILLAPVSRGGLTVEIEAVDAASGERVAAIAYEGKAGLGDAMNAYSTMGHVALEAERATKRFTTLIAGAEAHASSSGVDR